eukprot:6188802-Pleurochrysis_carterae.AAC.1
MERLERRLTSAGGPLAHGPPLGKRAKLRSAGGETPDGREEQTRSSRRECARRRATQKWDARR